MIFSYILIFLILSYLIFILLIVFFPVLKSEPQPFKKNLADSTVPEGREDISFIVKGDKISGWLYTPKGISKGCIIMSHGFNGTKDCLLENYATRFTQEGYSVITYDYRTYGESEGEPRQMLSVRNQLEDLRGAVGYAKKRGLHNIILWGTSAGAPYGIVVASEDPQVKGVISQCGSYNHKADSAKGIRENGYLFYIKLLPHGIRDKWRGRLGLSRHMIPAYGRGGTNVFIRGDSIFMGAQEIGLNSKNFINEVCGGFMLQPHGPDVLEVAKLVDCPILILHCEKDEIISSESYYPLVEAIGDKLEVETYPIGHFEIYKGEWFKAAINRQISFLNKTVKENDYNIYL